MNETRLGKYTIREEIGRGGFATVYRAEDTTLGREVALKILDPLLMRDDTFVARFQREARAAARLEHPHIVPIYDVGESGERLYIAMRLVRGGSLASLLKTRARLPWEETLNILRQVGDALAYAHTEGIVHRDIKPDNILMDERSGAMLSDFGFAQLVGSSTLTMSLSGGIVGTPAYIPPEIWEGVRATPASDIYALGCVLYEMLMGQALFEGATPMAVMRAHDRGAVLPAEWPLEMPVEMAGILARALARDVTTRYSDIAAFMAALNAVQTAAVAERIAAEVAQLCQGMNAAFEQGQFESVITLSHQLFKLQPNHAEGKLLEERARNRLTQRQAMAERLAQERAAVEARQAQVQTEAEQWSAHHAALAGKETQRQAEEQRLRAELAEIEQLLQVLADERKSEQQQMRGVEEELRKIESLRQDLQPQHARLERLAELLTQGQLEAVEAELTGAARKPDPQPTPEVPADSSRGSTPPQKAAASAPQPQGKKAITANQPVAAPLPPHRARITPDNLAHLRRLLTLDEGANQIKFSPDGVFLAARTLWNIASGQRCASLGHEVSDFEFSPDSHMLAFFKEYGYEVQLWNMATQTVTREIESPSHIWCMSFSPDGKTLAFGCGDGHIRLWELDRGSMKDFANMNSIFNPNGICCIAFSPTGKSLVASADGKKPMIWSFPGGKPIARFEVAPQVTTLSFSQDGRLLALGTTDRGIVLWDAEKQRQICVLGERTAYQKAILSPNGMLLAAVAGEGDFQIWNVESRQRLKVAIDTCKEIAFSPDGTLLAVAGPREIKLWGIPASAL